VSYTYTTSGATSNKGHPLHYRFNWGDGSQSTWSTSKSASHSWSSTGSKTVTVTARCQTHTDKTNTSDGLVVNVIHGGETISGTITDETISIAAKVEAWQNGSLVASVDTPDGSYSLSGLSAAEYAVRAYSEGYYAKVYEGEVMASASGIDIALESAPTILPSPVSPCDFWDQDGTYFHDNDPSDHIPELVQIGDVITAKDPDGVICGLAYVGDAGTGEGDYFIHVNGDDPNTTGIDEGASEGDTIIFFINGKKARVISGTPEWSSGGSRKVSLEGLPPCVEIDLGEGWNLVSFNVEPSDTGIATVLSSIDGLYTYVSGYKSSIEGGPGFETYVPGRPFNDLTQLDHYHGYWIKMSSVVTLEICGSSVAVTTPIELGEGWNLVSYLPSEAGAMPDVLSSVDGSYSYVSGYKSAIEGGPGFETYVPGRPFNDLTQLDHYHGYWIKMDSGGTLTYPILRYARGHASVPQPQTMSATVQAAPSLESILGSESISGQVSDGTQGIEGATVQAWQNDVKIKETTTSSDGSYELSGLEAGSYYVRAYKHDYYAKIIEDQKAPKSDVDIILESLPSIAVPGQINPCDFWSQNTTISSGIPIQIGDVVTAKDPGGKICGVTTVGDAGTGEGDYFIHVYGDDPNTPEDEGASAGDTIAFFVNKEYKCEQTGTWTAGSSIELDLHAPDYSLPVTLSAFYATMMEDKALIHWQTQTEQGNLGWDVYRSETKDGKYIKVNATKIAGAGTSAEPHTYQFVDDSVEPGNVYFYYLENIDFQGRRHRTHIIQVEMLTILGQIKYSALYPNFPNPFNPDTWIPFQLAFDSPVVIDIYNIKGKLVRRLDLGRKEAGYYLDRLSAAHWDGRSQTGERVASGIYFYKIKAGQFTATRRMVVVK